MKQNLKKSILDKIETEEIKPIPKNVWEQKNRIFWGILFIALIFAMIFGTFFFDDSVDFWMHGRGVGFSPFFFIPHLIWLIVIGILVFFGIREYRKTNSGYKTSTGFIISIIAIILFFGTFIFRGFGIGQFFRYNLIEKTPINSYLYNFSTWNSPENGRLAGEIIESLGNEIKLKDTTGKIWNIDIKESFISSMINLKIGEKIRVFGIITKDNNFKADKIAPEQGKGRGGNGRGMNRR